MEKTTERQKFGIRDIMTIAAMMVITFLVAMIIGSFTLPFPAVYLYGSAGIDAFIGAIFYLVAANRVNKHGLLFAWAAVYPCRQHERYRGAGHGGGKGGIL